MVQAITFDFWDTIAIDESDELKRKDVGLPTKVQARLQLFADEILRYHSEINLSQIGKAFQHANENFTNLWKQKHITLPVVDRFREGYRFLEIELTPSFDVFVKAIEEMEVLIPPYPVDNIAKVIASLATDYKLGIISDTIHTPRRGIKKMLQNWGIIQYFSGFIFSDEVGRSKPSPVVFKKAAETLEVSTNEILHIGDREKTDIDGAVRVRAKSVLYTGANDRDLSNQTRANAICRNYAELTEILKQL